MQNRRKESAGIERHSRDTAPISARPTDSESAGRSVETRHFRGDSASAGPESSDFSRRCPTARGPHPSTGNPAPLYQGRYGTAETRVHPHTNVNSNDTIRARLRGDGEYGGEQSGG